MNLKPSSNPALTLALTAANSIGIFYSLHHFLFFFFLKQYSGEGIFVWVILFILSTCILYLAVRKGKGWIWKAFS